MKQLGNIKAAGKKQKAAGLENEGRKESNYEVLRMLTKVLLF